MELWYSFQVTDNIQVTPAVYWLSRPCWRQHLLMPMVITSPLLAFVGGLVQTTFKF